MGKPCSPREVVLKMLGGMLYDSTVGRQLRPGDLVKVSVWSSGLFWGYVVCLDPTRVPGRSHYGACTRSLFLTQHGVLRLANEFFEYEVVHEGR
jgi:hypothetical protein